MYKKEFLMILTVTLNPCIDRTLNVSDFRVGGTTAVSGSRAEIGGKGLNVSRVLKNLGADTLCLSFSHEKGGSDLKAALDAVSIPCDLEEIPGELRVNIKIFDESRRTMSELNDKGCPVTEDAVKQMTDRIVSHFGEAELLVLAGSVPPGVSTDIYKILLEKARVFALPVILDASGPLLLNGIEGRPWLIKPNIDELSMTLGREFHSREEVIQAAREIVSRGIPYVCVSLGAEGALLVDEKEALYSPAPDVEVRGLQGAGDSLVAGFCLAFHEYHLNAGKSDSTSKASLPEDSSFARKLLCYAQAAAAGSLIKPGTAVCERADFEQYLPSIQVEKAGEFFDVRREDGSITGEVKLRSLVHRDGDWHGTVHMWVVDRTPDGKYRLLIQKRSQDKDNFPGYCDISSAGHLDAGDDYEAAAYRELYEELGIRAEKGELRFCFFITRSVETVFHGQKVIDRERAAVYLYEKPVDITKLQLQKEEVDEVFWVEIGELEKILQDPAAKYCVYIEEIQGIQRYL